MKRLPGSARWAFAAAAVIGTALAQMYAVLGPMVTTGLKVEPSPGDDYERWLASALLGVTFPFLIFFGATFIGKAINKVSLQVFGIIVAFSKGLMD